MINAGAVAVLAGSNTPFSTSVHPLTNTATIRTREITPIFRIILIYLSLI